MENQSQLIIYQTEDGQTKLEVRLHEETVWLTQKLMAELFQTTIPNINIHLKNIFEEGELNEDSTIKDFLIVQYEGKREVKRTQQFYNLDAIISVGYRIKSHVATKFRQWATQRIRELIVKGFVLDDERLKNPDLPYAGIIEINFSGSTLIPKKTFNCLFTMLLLEGYRHAVQVTV